MKISSTTPTVLRGARSMKMFSTNPKKNKRYKPSEVMLKANMTLMM